MAAKPTFGEKLKDLRARKGLTQQQLADLMFVSRGCVSNWENSTRLPDSCLLGRLARCLDVDRYQLFDMMQDETNTPLNVVIVDDEPVILKGFVHMLSGTLPDADVWGFRNAEEVLLFASANVVPIAFIDIELGGMSGIELAQRLMKLYPRINIIFLTSHDEYTREALDMHVSGYLLKPLTPAAIRREMAHLRFPVRGLDAVP